MGSGGLGVNTFRISQGWNTIGLFLMLGLMSSCGNLIKSAGSIASGSNASSGSSTGGGGGTSGGGGTTTGGGGSTTGGGGGSSPPATVILDGFESKVVRALSVSRVIYPGYNGPLIRVKAVGARAEADIRADSKGDLNVDELRAFANQYNEDVRILRIYDQTNVRLTPAWRGDRFGYSDLEMPVIVTYDGQNQIREIQVNPSTARYAARFSSPYHRLATIDGFLPESTYDIHLVFRSENEKAILYIAGDNQYAFKMNPAYTTTADPNNLDTVVFRNWDTTSASFLIDAGVVPIDLGNYSQSSMSALLTQGVAYQFKVFSMLGSSPDRYFGNKADFGGYKNYIPWDDYDFLGYFEEEVILHSLDQPSNEEIASRLMH
jgi:hypothetical protein